MNKNRWKLGQLCKSELDERHQNALRGGRLCPCTCICDCGSCACSGGELDENGMMTPSNSAMVSSTDPAKSSSRAFDDASMVFSNHNASY